MDFRNSREVQFRWLNEQGFEVVEYRKVTAETLDEAMDYFAEAVTTNDFPSDGLVALYDDIAYGESLGTTAKFPRNAMAFKWPMRCVIRDFWRLSGARPGPIDQSGSNF